MAAEALSSGISLRGGSGAEDPKPGHTSAILLKLNADTVQHLKKASQENDSLRFVTGKTPKLRIGSRSIDLTISPDAFRNELFASSVGVSSPNFTFTNVVSHRAEANAPNQKSSGDTAGADAALAALKSSLASYEQDKQAKQANITNSILPAPKNRFDAARKEKLARKRGLSDLTGGSQPGSPSMGAIGANSSGVRPTSAPASQEELRVSAMRKALMHLLAMQPTTNEEIVKKSHIPKSDLDAMLLKVGKMESWKWQLTDRTYKELDVWGFEYPSQEDRQAAIDNAVRAYDRMRLGREDPLWQMLLPKQERGKGKVLSKLHFGAGQVQRGLTPNWQPSPLPHANGGNDSKAPSAATTPNLGPSPRPASSKGDVMKRLLSKDPKKARAQEDAKDKKRKEREAAASDVEKERPTKKQQTKKTNPVPKSAEFVHSSDEESSDEVPVSQVTSQPKTKVKSETAKAPAKSKPAITSSNSSDSSDTALKTKVAEKAAAKAKQGSSATKESNSPAVKPKSTPGGKSTPQAKSSNNLSAPNSQQKSQRSPQKLGTLPHVPSPLGASRPRVQSDVSDRGAVGVQSIRQAGSESETPRGLGITNGVRKRQDTVTSTQSAPEKDHSPPDKAEHLTVNGTDMAKTRGTNGVSQKSSNGVKRKADEQASKAQEGTTNGKQRKTESTPKAAVNTPDGPSGSDSSVIESITYSQGVKLAEKFETYYPKYTVLYDEQEAMQKRGEKVSREERERLMQMHERLAQMKKEITMASQREGED